MRVKMLRTLGPNLPDIFGIAAPEGQPLTSILESQVREFPDEFARPLLQHGLAEETDEELTKLPESVAKVAKPAPKAATAKPAAHGESK